MLTAVRNQFRITRLSIKYSLIREMLNKATFISNVVFMVLNDACFIIQWIILFSLKENFGGYTLKQVLLLWGMAAGTYGTSRFFFKNAFSLSDLINKGKLDAYLVQPKNVLIQAITSGVESSALGDILYGYVTLIIYGITIKNFFLFTLFIITGGLIVTSMAVIFGSLSFWLRKADMIADTGNSLLTNFATYPDGIFKGVVKLLLYTVVPIGFAIYIPINIITDFNFIDMLKVLGITVSLIGLSNIIFNIGLRRYSSSNLMSARI